MTACSTQKSKWTNVTYHNTTCHYNVWWNGNESLKEGVKKLDEAHKDDYTQILPVYKLGDKTAMQSVRSLFEKSIEKGVKGIKKHSIYIQGREYVPYVKKCYLLTAYASFYKQDYAATANSCRIITSQYAGTTEADEARILLARCLTYEGQYADAEVSLDQLADEEAKNSFSVKLADKLYLAMIESLLPQEKYKKSVQYIRLALDATKDRKTKARLYFIMAQIYQKLDKRPTALKYFEKNLDCKPDYVMEFNARINMASCTDLHQTDIKQIEKGLDKMLKDKKNEEFHDQIYYAKAEMYLGIRDVQKACDNYKLSVSAAVNNPAQKAKSALRMADVLYDMYENYDLAQTYYDTAMQIIKAGYPHFDEIRSRYNTLTALVENTRVISRNDSILVLAAMDSVERDDLIKNRINELIEKEKAEEEKRILDELKGVNKAQQNTLQGDWYFYNTENVNKGKESFRKKWGMRPLDDFWFIEKRDNMMMANMVYGSEALSDEELADTSATEESKTPKVRELNDPNDPHSVAYYLKDLPKTQGRVDSMHMETAQCLLNAGYIYNDGIENTDRALECYLRLAKDYPQSDEIVQAFYQLWRIYSKQGTTPAANYYKDMVLMGFPDGDYANMIRDDEYYLEIIKRNEEAKTEYATVYNLYRRKRYKDVVAHVDAALKRFDEEPLMGKYRYWKGLSYAQMGDTTNAIDVLSAIITDYPDTSTLVELTKEQLNYVRNGRFSWQPEVISKEDEENARSRYGNQPADKAIAATTVNKGEEKENEFDKEAELLPQESRLFRYREKMQHFVVIILKDRKIIATQLQYRVSNFNIQNYANSGYKVSPLQFTDTIQMLTIHRFADAKEAEDYCEHLCSSSGPMSKFNKEGFYAFSISNQNYSTLYARKDVEAYKKFYDLYYKQKK